MDNKIRLPFFFLDVHHVRSFDSHILDNYCVKPQLGTWSSTNLRATYRISTQLDCLNTRMQACSQKWFFATLSQRWAPCRKYQDDIISMLSCLASTTSAREVTDAAMWCNWQKHPNNTEKQKDIDEWKNGWMEEWMGEWMDGWIIHECMMDR